MSSNPKSECTGLDEGEQIEVVRTNSAFVSVVKKLCPASIVPVRHRWSNCRAVLWTLVRGQCFWSWSF